MAVIARSSKCAAWTLLFGVLFALPASPDQSADVRAVLQRIATGLSEGNSADALKEFDPSLPNYDRLRDDFEGLIAGYQLTNEVNVIDEQDTPEETNAVVDWTLTLGNLTNPGIQDSRNQRLHVRFVRRKNRWKIIEFSPIDFFNPQYHPRSENPPR
jgi:hypothetical protein